MRPPTPLQAKIPYDISTEPMDGSVTSLGGVAVLSRLFRGMKLPGSCDANLEFFRKIALGYQAGQMVESIVTGLLLGIDCVEDLDMLRGDETVARILGYQTPSTRCVRDWLEKFHDQALATAAYEKALELDLKSAVPDSSAGLCALQKVLGTSARSAASRHPDGAPLSATVDADGTIIESHKAGAFVAYEGTRGYQPLTALWAEANVILSTEFRDGNVPGHHNPLACVEQAFSELPGSIEEFYFRADSAYYNCELLDWLDEPCRERGPQGVEIKYTVSARMSDQLAEVARLVPESAWIMSPNQKEGDDVLHQWTELEYTPTRKPEKKDAKPRRYIGIRLIKKQGELFADGNDRKHFAVVTNREERGDVVLAWHREKAGTIEHTQDELKNALSGARLPSKFFGANAAWFTLNAIAYNIASALRSALPDPEMKTARIKRLRFNFFNVSARLTRFSRKITLRFAKDSGWIKALLKVFKAFPCRIQPTG
jgi:hypothetical protein